MSRWRIPSSRPPVGIGQLDRLDTIIEPMLRSARIPGGAVAVVAQGETVFAEGYGYRDLEAKLPMTTDTLYPIGSTSKALNAALLGMLVEEGKLAWDSPVQDYLPGFHLADRFASTHVTLRDLITMRTGLPRHDFLWLENPISRTELVERLRFLQPSAGFRERFQYNNLTVVAAAHVAESITGEKWEALVQARIFTPLAMRESACARPNTDKATRSYHENAHRELLQTQDLDRQVCGPAGTVIHSTVEDMARWMAFNLNGGRGGGGQLLQAHTLEEIHSPQMVCGADLAAPAPQAAYAMGWFVDTYNGCRRLSHGGYLNDVNSEVMLFPREGIGIVSFTNFGCPGLARIMGQHAFDFIMDLPPVQTAQEKLAQYEKRIEENLKRLAAVNRVAGTSPSHPLSAYAGVYEHAGYGHIAIQCCEGELIFCRGNLRLPLEHWHYDAWVVQDNDRFAIHAPHAFDHANRILFETNADGEISALSIRLEPAVAPIQFEKH